ncbi:Aim14p [Sugiyamaella lignohabitans]|uniref:Aim14p n=1 Tax=Sugiyamaella lignohabitans TaxID=796027 RepID=A0A161HFK1_9ASCO|nr:Aim14p [Sugiyamaella lignohabitans]ANB11321.1 Aim14p [Sugiyamaella lignohabitans]
MDAVVLSVLQARHEGHHDEVPSPVIPGGNAHHGAHYANITYGYILVLISIIGMVWISVTNTINIRSAGAGVSGLTGGISGLSRKLSDISLRGFRLGHLLSKPSPRLVLLPLWILVVALLSLTGGATGSLNGLAKRLGRITFAIVPLILFLSLKPSPLPNTYYVKLLTFHKWIARSAVLTGSLHGILYTAYFIRQGTTVKILKVDNLLGVVLLLGFLVVFITSLRPIRTRYYRLFYALHYPLAWVFLIIASFHARPGVGFLALWSAFILLGQAFYRVFTSRTIRIIENYQVSPTLYSVTLPRDIMPDYFPAGSHIRLGKRSLWSPLSWLEPTHPYTIASLSSDEANIRLLIRKTNFTIQNGVHYTISGPFASRIAQELSPSTSSSSDGGADSGVGYKAVGDGARKVVVFAGGSGLSFAAPLVRELSSMGIAYRLIWITRDKTDLKALELLEISAADVYITGNNPNSSSNVYSDILDRGNEFNLNLSSGLSALKSVSSAAATVASGGRTRGVNTSTTGYNDYEEEIEFDELVESDPELSSSTSTHDDDDTPLEPATPSDASSSSSSSNNTRSKRRSNTNLSDTSRANTNFNSTKPPTSSFARITITYGRPDFSQSTSTFILPGQQRSSWAIACGPKQLVHDVETWATANHISFSGEKYFL